MEQIVPLDWHRMFLGDTPPLFYVEIAIRTILVYGYSLALIRWIGGRGVGQMSIVEFLLVVALGSAVGDAMFYPEVPLMHAFVVITLVVVINKLIDIGMCRHAAIRHFFAGRSTQVIRDGRIDPAALSYLKVSRDELFESLRQGGIRNVARVEHGFLEPSGAFSLFRAKGPVKGLQIMPLWEFPLPRPEPGKDKACGDCGTVAPHTTGACPTCGSQNWMPAQIDSDDEE